MRIFSYENKNGIATVGFTGEEKNFAVYADVHFIPGEAHEKLLQRAYINAKSAIDYEQEQDSHLLTTDEEGEPFTPDEPAVARVEVEPLQSVEFSEGEEEKEIELKANVYDQYGDPVETDVTWEATGGVLNGSTLSVGVPSEVEELTVTGASGDVSDDVSFIVFPYVAPAEENSEMAAELEELKSVVNAMIGVETIE